MLVYLLAFALTAFCISRAARYYRVSLQHQAAGGSPDCSRVRLRDMDTRYVLWFALSVFPLFFIAAVRYDVGTDYFFTYIPNFYLIAEGGRPYSEWGFTFLNQIIYFLTKDAQWLIVVTSFIYVFFAVRTIVHCSEMPVLSVVILLISCVYFMELNNVRQGIAAIIVFSAVPYLVKPGYVRFFIAVLFAYFFHHAVVLMVIPFLFVNINFFREKFLLFAIVVTVLLPVICALAAQLLRYTKYYYYFVSDYNDNSPTKVNILYHLFFFIFAAIVLYRNRMKDKYGYVLLAMQFFAFYISAASLFIRISEMINRLTVFFSVFQLLLIPHMCSVEKRQGGTLVIAGTYIVLYTMYMVYVIVLRGAHEVLPYQWIF